MTTSMPCKIYQNGPGGAKVLFLGEFPKGARIEDGMNGTLRFSDRRSTRKLSQNNLYWRFINTYCLPAIHEHYDPTMGDEELHEILGQKLMPVLKVINGKAFKSRKPTKDLSISDFADYFNKAIEYAGSELGVPTELFIAEYAEYKKYFGG